MNKETQKILFAVLRVFVEDMARGNDNTLHAQEITNQVCRALHRRKEKEKKNTYAFVVAALRALKAKRVLFEAIDDWSDDRLARPKAVERRSAFGLTRPAVEYLTDEENLKNHSVTSDALLAALLGEFGLITPKQKEISVPAVLVETVAAIKQEEFEQMPEPKPVVTASNKDNVQRLIATVRNRSANWSSSAGTPADLLGAMCELYFNSGDGDKTPVSAQRLNFSWHNYQKCRDFLRQHGLVESFSERRNPYGKNKMKAHGIKLTSLGLEVAVDGDFKDERQTTVSKSGPMLKNHKKQPEQLPSLSNLDSQQLADMLAKMSRLEQEIADLRAGANTQPPPQTAPVAPPPPQNYEYHDVSTVSIVLMSAIPGLVTSIKELLDSRYLDRNTDHVITQINVRGLYLSITEIEKALNGIKAYVSECLHNNTAVDIKLLEQYADDFREAAKYVGARKTLPILGAKILEKCVLRQSEAIEHPVWKRPEPAQV